MQLWKSCLSKKIEKGFCVPFAYRFFERLVSPEESRPSHLITNQLLYH